MEVPQVEGAFRVLYEDFLPIRLGGDTIFRCRLNTLPEPCSLSRCRHMDRSQTPHSLSVFPSQTRDCRPSLSLLALFFLLFL
jgi:hypothetical protein